MRYKDTNCLTDKQIKYALDGFNERVEKIIKYKKDHDDYINMMDKKTNSRL